MVYSDKLRGHLALLGANACWGLMAPVAKLVMIGGIVSPLLLADFRVVGAAILFWLLSATQPREHVPAADLLRMAGAGMLGILFNQCCYIFGVGYTSPGEASVITTTMPIWVMILARIILRSPITLRKSIGIAVGATGAVAIVLSASQTAGKGSNPVLGDILVLTAQCSYALYLTLYKNFLSRYSLVTLMKWMFTFAAIPLIPLSVSTIADTPWQTITHSEWAGIAYVVVMGTFVAYICMMTGQKALPPTVVGMYNYFQPIVATAIGLYLGLETFTAGKIAAIALIFAGIYLVTTSPSAPSPHPTKKAG